MADLYTDVATTQNTAKTKGGTKVDNGYKVSADLRVARASAALVGDETTTDTIYVVWLPKGSTVFPALSQLECDDPGTALTIDIGYELEDGTGDEDRFADALDIAAGGAFLFNAGGTVAVAELTPFQLPADAWITVTPKTATTLTAAADITFYVVYAPY